MNGLMEQAREIVEGVILFLGYPGVMLLMLLENLFPPLPSELVLPFAGFLAGREQFSLAGVVLAGTAGSVLGALVLYALGARVGEATLRGTIQRYGRWVQLSERDLDRALGAFRRHGEIIVLLGRLIPLLRSLVSLPAGLARMPLHRFLLLTTLGSALWSAALAYSGFVLGRNWSAVLDFMQQYEKGMLVLIGLLLLGLVVTRLYWRLQDRAPEES